MSGRTIDLDHAATTRLRPEVLAAVEPFRSERYGNPSGTHALAREALRALDEAREQVAALLGCRPGEVVFTSGGTESDVHAVSGGLPPESGPCEPLSAHGYFGRERETVGAIAQWMSGRPHSADIR